MKEELHQMLDGELPDDAMAELLHLLSVDPEKRRLFRQQMVLQHALVRNEAIDTLTPDEDLEMLSSLSRAVGITEPGAGGWKSWVAVGMLTVGLFVGGGAGYIVGASYNSAEMATRTEPAVEKLQLPHAPTVIPATVNHDAVAAALRESLTGAIATERPAVASTKVTPKRTTRTYSAVRRPPVRTGGGSGDLTGANEVSRNRHKKRHR
jgi:hypothetical protein